VMRCWERNELDTLLGRHHFGELSCFGAYDPSVPAGATDRLVVVAQRQVPEAQNAQAVCKVITNSTNR